MIAHPGCVSALTHCCQGMVMSVTGDSIASQKVPSRADVREGTSKAGAAVVRQASKYLQKPSYPEKVY